MFADAARATNGESWKLHTAKVAVVRLSSGPSSKSVAPRLSVGGQCREVYAGAAAAYQARCVCIADLPPSGSASLPLVETQSTRPLIVVCSLDAPSNIDASQQKQDGYLQRISRHIVDSLTQSTSTTARDVVPECGSLPCCPCCAVISMVLRLVSCPVCPCAS